MAEGELSPEQLDVIADTCAKTDGAAADEDEDFISAVAGVDPDRAEVIAGKFVADHGKRRGLMGPKRSKGPSTLHSPGP